MKPRIKIVRLSLLILSVAALLAACAPQKGTVTYENYTKLKFGMSYEAVAEILGKPFNAQPFLGIQQYTWVNGERHIHAKFIFGRAVYYSSKGLAPPPPTGHQTGVK
jgi:hypothetical protein